VALRDESASVNEQTESQLAELRRQRSDIERQLNQERKSAMDEQITAQEEATRLRKDLKRELERQIREEMTQKLPTNAQALAGKNAELELSKRSLEQELLHQSIALKSQLVVQQQMAEESAVQLVELKIQRQEMDRQLEDEKRKLFEEQIKSSFHQKGGGSVFSGYGARPPSKDKSPGKSKPMSARTSEQMSVASSAMNSSTDNTDMLSSLDASVFASTGGVEKPKSKQQSSLDRLTSTLKNPSKVFQVEAAEEKKAEEKKHRIEVLKARRAEIERRLADADGTLTEQQRDMLDDELKKVEDEEDAIEDERMAEEERLADIEEAKKEAKRVERQKKKDDKTKEEEDRQRRKDNKDAERKRLIAAKKARKEMEEEKKRLQEDMKQHELEQRRLVSHGLGMGLG
jgi:hypothetical protein